jgi:hypothetical protein
VSAWTNPGLKGAPDVGQVLAAVCGLAYRLELKTKAFDSVPAWLPVGRCFVEQSVLGCEQVDRDCQRTAPLASASRRRNQPMDLSCCWRSANPSGGAVSLLVALGSAQALIMSAAWSPKYRHASAPPVPITTTNTNKKTADALDERLDLTLMDASSSTLMVGSSSKKRRDLPCGSRTVSRLGACKS